MKASEKSRNKKNTGLSAAALILAWLAVMLTLGGCLPQGGGDATSAWTVDTSEPATAGVTTVEQISPPETTLPETTAEATTESPGTEPLPTDIIVNFAACGDNILYRPAIWEAADRAQAGGRKYNFRPIYKNVESIIAAADVAFINQETVIGGAEFGYSGYPLFNSPQDIADDLVDLGFDIVSLANNHILDMRERGLLNTINYWRTLPVVTVGAYLDAEDEATLRIIERNGVRIAVLAYTYGANGRTVAADSSLVVPFYKEPHKDSPDYGTIFEEKLRSEVAKAKAAADVVLVSVHWGYEDTQKVNEEQKKVAQILCDAGADIILGQHPHVLQPIEYIKSTDGEHTAFCSYSLGNFLGMQGYDYNALSGILTFDIRVGLDGVAVENVLLTPTVSYFNKDFRDNEIYLLSDFTDELCRTHCVAVRGGDGTFGGVITLRSLRYYLNNAIADEYLPPEFRK